MPELEQLCQGLRERAVACPGSPLGPVADLAIDLARDLSYTHRAGMCRELVDHLVDGGPRPRLIALRGVEHRQEIGTDGHVFLWLGVAALQAPPFVLFLDPVLDQEEDLRLVAAPWDTGGLRRHGVLGHPVTTELARYYVEQFSLPTPEHREYLAEVLHFAFRDPADYLRGRPPLPCYPGYQGPPREAMALGDLPSCTFEARVPDELELSDRILSIVLDLGCLAEDDLRASRLRVQRLTRWCGDHEIRLVEVRTPGSDGLRSALVQEMERILGERGTL